MSAQAKTLTMAQAMALLEAVLTHGHGEIRFVVSGSQIIEGVPSLSVRTPRDVDNFVRACYGHTRQIDQVG